MKIMFYDMVYCTLILRFVMNKRILLRVVVDIN